MGLRMLRALRDPAVLVCASVAFILGMGFFMPTHAAWCDLFYVLAGPGILLALKRGGFDLNWRDPAVLLPVALIGWFTLTQAWCINPARRADLFYVQGFCCLVFFLGAVQALRQSGFAARLGRVLIAGGSLNALISIGFYPSRNGIGGRLGGIGETRQAILGASLIAVAALWAFWRASQPKRQNLKSSRGWYFAAGLLLTLFILLTQSRGPIAGFGAGLLLLIVAHRRRWRILALAMGFPAMLLWFDRGLRAFVWGAINDRGTSWRPEIWRASIASIELHPWIGNGAGSLLGYNNFTFPHDLYLSLLFYSGMIGFALFVALVVLLFWRLCHRPGAERILLWALWANMLISGLTDYGQIIQSPSPLWYIVWLPIAYTVVYTTNPITPRLSEAVDTKDRAWPIPL